MNYDDPEKNPPYPEEQEPIYTISVIVEGALDHEEYEDYADLARERANELAKEYENVANTTISVYDTWEGREIEKIEIKTL